MDKAVIRDLLVECNVGAYEKERIKKQAIVFNIEAFFDAAKASKSDKLIDTVDYDAIINSVKSISGAKQFYLLESLLDEIIVSIFKNKLIKKIIIRAEKPNLLLDVKSVGIEFERCQ